jgi:hypothetical protein
MQNYPKGYCKMNRLSKPKQLMKKVILLLIALSVCSTAFTDDDTDVDRQIVLGSKAFKGQVDSIIMPDLAHGITHDLIVINDKGTKMKFYLTSGLGVYNSKLEVSNLKNIDPGDTVLVEYTTNKRGNVYRAISITIE